MILNMLTIKKLLNSISNNSISYIPMHREIKLFHPLYSPFTSQEQYIHGYDILNPVAVEDLQPQIRPKYLTSLIALCDKRSTNRQDYHSIPTAFIFKVLKIYQLGTFKSFSAEESLSCELSNLNQKIKEKKHRVREFKRMIEFQMEQKKERTRKLEFMKNKTSSPRLKLKQRKHSHQLGKNDHNYSEFIPYPPYAFNYKTSSQANGLYQTPREQVPQSNLSQLYAEIEKKIEEYTKNLLMKILNHKIDNVINHSQHQTPTQRKQSKTSSLNSNIPSLPSNSTHTEKSAIELRVVESIEKACLKINRRLSSEEKKEIFETVRKDLKQTSKIIVDLENPPSKKLKSSVFKGNPELYKLTGSHLVEQYMNVISSPTKKLF